MNDIRHTASLPRGLDVARAATIFGLSLGCLCVPRDARAEDAAAGEATSTAHITAPTSTRGESLWQRANSPWPTAKRVTWLSLVGVQVASLGYAFYALAQASRAASEHDSHFPRVGPRGDIDCLTADQCAALRANRDEQDAWHRRCAYGLVGSGLASVALASVAMLWPNGGGSASVRLVPSASHQGAAVGVAGRF